MSNNLKTTKITWNALNITHEVERLSEQYTYALQIGSPVILSDKEMDEVIQRFKSYGNWNKIAITVKTFDAL